MIRLNLYKFTLVQTISVWRDEHWSILRNVFFFCFQSRVNRTKGGKKKDWTLSQSNQNLIPVWYVWGTQPWEFANIYSDRETLSHAQIRCGKPSEESLKIIQTSKGLLDEYFDSTFINCSVVQPKCIRFLSCFMQGQTNHIKPQMIQLRVEKKRYGRTHSTWTDAVYLLVRA